jgi:tyramine---L-glutamate ligase
MRVFVSEYVCGGAWPEEHLDSSLAVEGRAMLVSLVEDLLRISEVDVVTTWDHRLGEFPLAVPSRCEVVQTFSPIDEEQAFQRLCDESDAAFVIAPEFHGLLTARVQIASSRTKLIGCDVAATALCSDKLKLAEHLASAEIPTVPTESFVPVNSANASSDCDPNFPCVVKPRDGAGSLLTFKVGNSDELARVTEQLLSDDEGFSFVRQPFIEGIAVSCAAIVTAEQGRALKNRHIDVLPPCKQVLSADGRFNYEGADFPAPIEPADEARIECLVRRCCSVIPGLHGFVGFDLLVPYEQNIEPIIVEINPRLTTGFLLWQKMCNDNLAARMLGPARGVVLSDKPPLSWKTGSHSIRISSMSE